MIAKKYIDRFWTKVTKNSIWNGSDCWIWHGTKVNNYGQYAVNLERYRPHRLSWMLKNGPIQKGKMILHKCDNSLCVNPKHLYEGTHEENMRDRMERGRTARGSGIGNNTLFEGDVLEIRRLRASGMSTYKIWNRYKDIVSYGAIKNVCSRKTWNHL